MGCVKIDKNLIKQIEDYSITDYQIEGEYVPLESIEPMLEDLLCEIHSLEERLDDRYYGMDETDKLRDELFMEANYE